jgi:putative sterol carrier protein
MLAKKALENLVARISPANASGVKTNLQFNLGDESYTLLVDDGAAQLKEGIEGEAECVLTASPDDFLKILSGDTNPMMAVMMGKLKLSNAGAMMKYAGMLGLM